MVTICHHYNSNRSIDALKLPKLRKWIIGKCYSVPAEAPQSAKTLEQFTMWALPYFTGDSREYLLKLPKPPAAGERRRPVEQQLETWLNVVSRCRCFQSQGAAK